MGLYSILATSASGMAAQSALLNTVSDNIANADTTGYKRATAEFSSLVLNSNLVSDYNSGSVNVDPQIAIGEQGAITSTSSVTDLAVQGNGFFMVQSPSGQDALTRVGSFSTDGSGYLVNAAGYTLLGEYPTTGTNVANGFGGLVPVQLSPLGLQATATTTGSLDVNLPSIAATVPAASLPSAYTSGATLPSYTDKTSIVTYDNLGKQVTLDVYFSNEGSNTWEVDVYNTANATSGGFPYTGNGATGAPLATATLTFDPATGDLASTSATSISVAIPNGKTMTLDMSQTTQLAADYTVLNATTDGNAASQVSKYTIGTDGTLSAVYANGSVVPLYDIPLANVTSPNGMSVISGNAFLPGTKSGNITRGTAGTAGLGTIESNSLEFLHCRSCDRTHHNDRGAEQL